MPQNAVVLFNIRQAPTIQRAGETKINRSTAKINKKKILKKKSNTTVINRERA